MGVPLFCGAAKPLGRLRVILRNALAFVIRGAETVLRMDVPLFCGAAKPFGRLRVILRNALAFVV